MEHKKNVNIVIKATRIPGAKELMKGEPAPSEGIFIPIDNFAGVCINGYNKKRPDGLKAFQALEDVELHFTGYAFQRENPAGNTHGIKPCISSEMLEHMLESQVKKIPWVGFVTPWQDKKV